MSVEAEETQDKSGVRDTIRVVIHALILALLPILATRYVEGP